MHRQIILDTETTGLEPSKGHRIIEIGCLEMINRRLTDNHYHVYINPEREVEAQAIEVHGITNEFLAQKPTFDKIAASFLDYVGDAELIIHNAPFDIGFINHEYSQHYKKKFDITQTCSVIDTLKLARKKHPGQPNSLDALCRRYHVDNSNRDLHGALLDSELLAQVYLLMTGGQTTLFAAQDSTNENTTEESHIKTQHTPGSLPIIKANETELKAHRAFLNMLRDKGECVWQDS